MKRNLNILLVLFFLILFFPACSKSEKTGKNSRDNIEFTDVSQLNKSEYTIGYAEGQSSALLLRKILPNARTKSFLEQVTGYEAVRQGKVTAYAFDKVQTELAIKNGLKGVRILGNLGEPIPTAVGISPVSKIPHLEEKINEFITECRKSGLLADMLQRWTGFTSDTIPEIKPAENPEYNLVIGTTGIVPPYSYHKGTELSGFDIELAMRFASWLGASYTFKVYDYGAIIAAAVTGDIDCIMANLNVTEERKEKISFSMPIYSEQNVIVVRDDGISAGQNSSPVSDDKAFNSFADLNKKGVTIGMGTGTNFVSLCEKAFPLATLQYYNTHSDMAALILKDKLSAMVLDSPSAAELQKEVKGLKQLDEFLGKNDYAIGFPKTEKGAALRDQIDEFIEKKEKDGSLKKLQEVWFGQDDSIKKIQPLPPSSPKGTVRMVTDSLTPPFSYIKEGQTVGYDIALVSEFCLEYGYALSITSLDFSAILPALHSASFDMAAGGMSVTSERKESIYFSRPLYEGKSVILVKDGAKSESLESKEKDKSQASAFVPERFKNVTLKYNSISEMNKDGLVLGMHTGFVMVDKLTRQMLPKAKIEYYKTTADMAYLVSSGKIDGFVNDEPIIRYVSLEIPDLGYIDFDGKSLPMVACFPKNEKGRLLRDEFNSYIKKCKTDGRLKAIDDLWLSKDEEKKVVDLGHFDAKKGVIRLGTTADTPPFEYMKDGKIVGYEIDLVARFCREAGYGLEIQDVPFDSLIMGLQSDMYDMVASCLSDTPAHRESTNISEAIYDSRLVMAVQILDHKKTGANAPKTKYTSADELKTPGKKRGVQTGAVTNLIESLAASFEKTFVREGRWRLVLYGTGITILISIFSALFGTLLGFIICGLRLSKNRIADGGAVIYIRIMQGLPMVVFLMILYYIVFAKSELSGIWVAVIGFGMNFGAYVSEMIRTGILAVDKGQMEAALALGYPKAKAFLKMVLPQAARHFLPVYQGEFISLVKMTSVVGYIAIQDLTKAGDIIRSRTYEAFFPLITTAIIYFMIAFTLTRILTFLQVRLDPRKRKEVVAKKIH